MDAPNPFFLSCLHPTSLSFAATQDEETPGDALERRGKQHEENVEAAFKRLKGEVFA